MVYTPPVTKLVTFEDEELQALRPEQVAQLEEAAIDHSDPEIRVAAAKALSRLQQEHSERAVGALAKMLGSGDNAVKRQRALAALQLQDTTLLLAHVDTFLDVVLNERCTGIRQTVAVVLGRIASLERSAARQASLRDTEAKTVGKKLNMDNMETYNAILQAAQERAAEAQAILERSLAACNQIFQHVIVGLSAEDPTMRGRAARVLSPMVSMYSKLVAEEDSKDTLEERQKKKQLQKERERLGQPSDDSREKQKLAAEGLRRMILEEKEDIARHWALESLTDMKTDEAKACIDELALLVDLNDVAFGQKSMPIFKASHRKWMRRQQRTQQQVSYQKDIPMPDEEELEGESAHASDDEDNFVKKRLDFMKTQTTLADLEEVPPTEWRWPELREAALKRVEAGEAGIEATWCSSSCYVAEAMAMVRGLADENEQRRFQPGPEKELGPAALAALREAAEYVEKKARGEIPTSESPSKATSKSPTRGSKSPTRSSFGRQVSSGSAVAAK